MRCRSLIWVLQAVVFAVACRPETVGPFKLEAELESVAADVAVDGDNPDYATVWAEGSRISVNGHISQALSASSAGRRTAEFTFDQRPETAPVYNILYPGSSSGNSVLFVSEQNSGSIYETSAPMFACVRQLDEKVTMHHLSSAVMLRLTGDVRLETMQISSVSGEKLSGDFMVETDGSGAFDGSLTPAESASDRISYSFAEDFMLSSEARDVVFTIPAGRYSKGISVLLKGSGGQSMKLLLFRNPEELQAGKLYVFPQLRFADGREFALAYVGDGHDAESGITDLTSESKDMLAAVKAGTFNIWSPQARKVIIDTSLSGKKTVSPQRYWRNSCRAVSELISKMDCDVMGLQEVTDTVYGFRTYKDGVRRDLRSLLGNGWSWVIFPSTSTSNSLSVYNIGSGDAIIYKPSVLTLEDSGRKWLAGLRTRPGTPDSYGTSPRTCTWAKFTHKSSGKQFYFLTVHLDLPDLGPDSDKNLPQDRNARELIEWFAPETVPEGVPSIICGDVNCTDGSSAYDILLSGRWRDSRDIMAAEGSLDYVERYWKGTSVLKNESDLSTWRPDHIFVDGLKLSSYKVVRDRMETQDGTLHYPSDHLPVVVIANM